MVKQSVKALIVLWIFECFFPTHFFHLSFTLREAQELGLDKIGGGGRGEEQMVQWLNE